MPRHRSYLDNLERGLLDLKAQTMRFTKDPIPSSGIDYINSLITRADIPYLLKFDNDIERLSRISREYEGPAYSDFIRNYPVRHKNFIHGLRHKTNEFLLVTEDLDLVDSIPFGNDDFNNWDLKPLRMLSNDSNDIELNIITSRLKYSKNPPFEAVFSINIIKLLMMYTKYRLLYPREFVENVNNYPFIFKTCLIPLLEDNIRTWLLKTIYDIVILKSIDKDAEYNFKKVVISDESVFIPNGRHSAILEIEDLITKCAEGKVKPDEVVVSLYLSKERNLRDEMLFLMNRHYIGDYGGSQYRWLEFVREYFLLTTVIGIYALQPESNRTKELKRLFDVMSNRLNNTRFWSNASHPFIVDSVKNKFETMCSLI